MGIGTGYSALEMVHTFDRINGVAVSYKITGRCSSDLPACYANHAKSEAVLGWKAEKMLEEMILGGGRVPIPGALLNKYPC